jgi:predicted nucleic acid-binding protein
MKVLIDTNVILDVLAKRPPFYSHAEKIFFLAAEEKIEALITASSVTDIYYLIRKHLKNSEEAKLTLLKLFTLFQIIDVTGDDCKKALELNLTDYEDALLATCARREKVEYIITRNIKDFTSSPVPAILPDPRRVFCSRRGE